MRNPEQPVSYRTVAAILTCTPPGRDERRLDHVVGFIRRRSVSPAVAFNVSPVQLRDDLEDFVITNAMTFVCSVLCHVPGGISCGGALLQEPYIREPPASVP